MTVGVRNLGLYSHLFAEFLAGTQAPEGSGSSAQDPAREILRHACWMSRPWPAPLGWGQLCRPA